MAIKDVTRTVTGGARHVNLVSDPASSAASRAGAARPLSMPLSVAALRVDPGVQMRAGGLDGSRVDQYTEAMIAGDDFPPVVVFNSSGVFWLADGFHRVAAAERAGLSEVPALVQQGDRRAALLYAAGANAGHGLDRTDDDKRRAVDMVLGDPEWRSWSDAEIARRCRVSAPFVAGRRALLENSAKVAASLNGAPVPAPSDVRLRVDKHGGVSPIRVANLGTVGGKSGAGSRGGAGSAVKAGAVLGRCSVCNKPLTDPAHAAAGIGPCCAAKARAGGGGDDGDADAERAALAERWRVVLGEVADFERLTGSGFVAAGLRSALGEALVLLEGVRG